ncbi:OprD family porin [Pseudomonas sp. 148P]|uniref:OprD family porin n=1 Tax=Pseudomonas ulcerans TaxID=3115852 RepID=A0ABU7HQN9_9PSED|nr:MULTISPECIES: OprD family porin [unclassified Pseudomonas]MEE1923785.1 OprD family porin [Pseudomonas sp. 147P]MEE1933845.1 OprD family porin [Pseudomonas sp. 148P]
MHRTLTPLALALLCSQAQAAFLDDSKASLESRNFYFNRDFRQDGAAQSKIDEWAQGFLLRYESGFTEGTLGFGVDAIGLLGVKLDSSPDRAGSGLLQRDREAPKRAQDSYGDLGLTAKVRASKSVLKVGTLIPKLPVLMPNDSRLLPQVFEGGQLNVQEITNLSLDLGQLRQVNQRDSQDYEDIGLTTGAAKQIVVRQAGSDRFDFGHLSYKWNDSLSTSYSYGGLEHFYRQHMLGLGHTWALGDGQTLKSDLRLARSLDDGGSNVDNKALGAMFTYGIKGHAFGLGYQRMSGDTGFAYINGADAWLVNFVQIGDFANKDERSWQARYDFNFASVGIPGLTFMTRYLRGDNVDLGAGRPEGKEWERDMDIGYVIQDGPLKNLGVKWRNATVRSSHFGNDLDENRLIVSYTLALW